MLKYSYLSKKKIDISRYKYNASVLNYHIWGGKTCGKSKIKGILYPFSLQLYRFYDSTTPQQTICSYSYSYSLVMRLFVIHGA